MTGPLAGYLQTVTLENPEDYGISVQAVIGLDGANAVFTRVGAAKVITKPDPLKA